MFAKEQRKGAVLMVGQFASLSRRQTTADNHLTIRIITRISHTSLNQQSESNPVLNFNHQILHDYQRCTNALNT